MTNKKQKVDSAPNSDEFDFFGPLFRVFFRVLIFIVLISAVFAALLAIILFPFNYSHNIFWNVFDALLGVLFILWIISWFFFGRYRHSRLHPRWHGYQTADDILRERYARGEISKKEFEEKLKELMRYK